MIYICNNTSKIDKLWGRFIKHLLQMQDAGITVEYVRKGEVILNGKRYKPFYRENTMSYDPIGWTYEDGQPYIVFTGYDIKPLIDYLLKGGVENRTPDNSTYKDKYNGWNDDGSLPPIEKCPFCGGIAKLCDNGFEYPIIDPDSGAYVDMDISEGDLFWCGCESCGATTLGRETPEAAIAEWNHRQD